MSSESKTQQQKKSSDESGAMGFAQFLGKIAWIVLIIEGIIFLIWGFYYLSAAAATEAAAASVGASAYVAQDIAYIRFWGIMYIIGGILCFIVSVALVKPRFSNKWADKDYDYLLNDVVKMGNLRIPLMLIIGIILEIFTYYWGGLIILIPLFILIFAGPKEYKWTEK